MRDRARRMSAREERQKYGQSLRQKVGRVSHADWDPKHRKISILDLLRASERGRLANLLPIKAARMAASPFGFYRGAVPIMASDLSMLPSSGIYAQLCGDAHVQNLGAFEGPDGRLIFGIDDFDETIRGPWEWDVKRMVASLVLAGREANNTEKECKTAALTFVGHARTGDPYAIAGYLGNSDKFDKAIASFGLAYADQSTKDFEEFTQAIRVGKIRAAKLAPAKPAKPAKAKRAKSRT